MTKFKFSSKRVFRKTWPYLAILAAHSIWGANFIVAKLTLAEFPVMSLAFLRFFLALILLLPFVLTEKKKVKIKREDLPRLIVVGLMMVTFNIAFFYEGLNRTTVSSSSILTMIIPLLSLMFSWMFLKEKIYSVNLLGIVLGLIGAVITFGVPLALLGDSLNPNFLIGNVLIILACICWVIGATVSKGLTERYSTLTITTIIFLVGAVSFIIPSVNEYYLNPSWIEKVTVVGIIGLVYIALASSIAAYFLYEWSIKRIGTFKADLFQYIEPPIAIFLAILILGERIDISFLAGSILIALGVYQGTRAKPEHVHHKAHRN